MRRRGFVAVALALTLTSVLSAGQQGVLGILLQSNMAHLGESGVSVGTTVYDGDRLSTEAGGSLGLRCGSATVYLEGQSKLTMQSGEGLTAIEADLGSGALVFSSARAGAISIDVSGARLRPVADVPTTGRIRIIGPRELIVFAMHGAVEFSYRNERETIAEGESYRVILDPTDQQSTAKKGAKKGWHRTFILVGAAAVATVVVTTILTRQGVVSPDRP